uniref:Pre-mRNA splicing Prp18-interacting factor n=1 Tax=Tanacetum cinerariifolium TaxID=118510 RepID=A0A6L2NUH7_TANCI|nr:hypothetical protein [Tanacetum cinerariifolium]
MSSFYESPQRYVYLCQICKSNSHYGYECSQRVSLVYEPEPCYIQNFSDNDYSHDLPSVNPLIDHHCYYECGNSLIDFLCYQCTCEFCGNGAHVGYNCPAQVPSFQTLPSFSQQYPCCEDCGVTHEPYQYKFIKSSVENLVPNPSESEGEYECDVPAGFTTFSNVLFDADYDFNSSDDQSFFDEDFPKKIYSNSLFDEEIIRMKIDQHPFNDDDYDSERDIPILEELLDNYSLSLPKNESYHFDIPLPSRPPAKPPDGNTGILNIKMMGEYSNQKVPIPNLTIAHVSNQEKSPDLLSHQGLKIFQPSAESPMINGKNTPILDVPLFHFYPP